MRVAALYRYAVKSMLGERVQRASVTSAGLGGDRRWAVYDADGKIGSSKSTKRFRAMDGLLTLRAGGEPPLVTLADSPACPPRRPG